jgi:hypothetical protein
MEITPMVAPLKKRYEDNNPDQRITNKCLFTCDEHGEWKERLKMLDHFPEVLEWISSVKESLKNLPAVVEWMNQEKGSKTTGRIIILAVVGIFMAGLLTFAIMYKNDMTSNLTAFKLESTERMNLFKTEFLERQAAIKLETSERQKVYEQNAKDQNAADTLRINTIVDIVAEMRTMLKLNEQFQKRYFDETNETKILMKELQNMVLEHRTTSESKKPKKVGD